MTAYGPQRHTGRTSTGAAPRQWSSAQLRAWHLQVIRCPQARTAHRTAALLLHRATKHGASVYGSQVRMAEELHQVERTIRYHLAVLEQLGLISVRRCRPERDSSGQWSRRYSNNYVLCFAKNQVAPTGKRLPVRSLPGHTTSSAAALAVPLCVENPVLFDSEVARVALSAARAALRSVSARPGD